MSIRFLPSIHRRGRIRLLALSLASGLLAACNPQGSASAIGAPTAPAKAVGTIYGGPLIGEPVAPSDDATAPAPAQLPSHPEPIAKPTLADDTQATARPITRPLEIPPRPVKQSTSPNHFE